MQLYTIISFTLNKVCQILVQSNSPVSELPFTIALFDSALALLTCTNDCTDVIHAALQRRNNSNNIAKRELLFPAD